MYLQIQALQLLLLTQDNVLRSDHKQVALHFLINLLTDPVVHVRAVVRVQLVH